MQKVFIIGGTGLLALNIALTKRYDWEIYLHLNRRRVFVPDIHFSEINLEDKNELTSFLILKEIDLVVNTAGLTSVEACENNKIASFNSNVKLAETVANVTSEIGVKLVHISTDHLFDGKLRNYSELDKPSPLNTYGLDKYRGEQCVLKENSDSLVIRTNFFGWGPSYRKSFSDYIIDTLREGKKIHLFEDVIFSPILIQTLLSFIELLIQKNEKGVFNIASRESISKFDFGLKIAKAFSLDEKLVIRSKISHRQDLIRRPLNMNLDIKKMEEVVGFEAPSLEEMIQTLKNLENTNFLKEMRNI